MEFVGEAVRDHTLAAGSSEQKVTAIGIATWGVIDSKEALTSSDVSIHLFPKICAVVL